MTYVHAQWGTTRHGTTSGFSRHQVLGEDPCPACKAKKSEYDARRMSAGEPQRKNRDSARAQQRALRRLKNAHPQEYGNYYLEEKAKIEAEHEKDVANSA